MTDLQRRTLDIVRNHYALHGRGPTQRAIARELGLAAPTAVNVRLQRLADLGYLKRTSDYSGNYIPADAPQIDFGRISTAALRMELERREAAARDQAR